MRRWWCTLHSPEGGILERFDGVTDAELWARLDHLARRRILHPAATLRSGGQVIATGQHIIDQVPGRVTGRRAG